MVAGGAGVLVEDPAYTSRFSQTFRIPAGTTSLGFTFHLEGFAPDPIGPPDAFEVALLDHCTGLPVVSTAQGLTETDALLNVQADGTTYFGNQVTVAGLSTSGSVGDYSQPHSVVVDLRDVTPDTVATLFFDLLGFGAVNSRVVIDDVFLVTSGDSPPTSLTLGHTSVAENAAGAAVGDLTVTDPDVGDTHTFTVTDPRFEVVGATLKLKTGVALDFEAEPTVALSVTATDAGGLSITRPFTITVVDVNEAPTSLTLGNATVPENAPGAAIGDLTVTDPDVGDTHTFTVSDPRFEVAGATLKLKTGVALDFESEPTVAPLRHRHRRRRPLDHPRVHDHGRQRERGPHVTDPGQRGGAGERRRRRRRRPHGHRPRRRRHPHLHRQRPPVRGRRRHAEAQDRRDPRLRGRTIGRPSPSPPPTPAGCRSSGRSRSTSSTSTRCPRRSPSTTAASPRGRPARRSGR